MGCGSPRWSRRASLVAGRRTTTTPPNRRRKWHVLSGEPQTAKLFDHEIVERMGPDFYQEVFAPAVGGARSKSQPYESIRDRLRRRWKPAPDDSEK